MIVNTMCPGLVKTDLSRGYAEKSAAFAVGIVVFAGTFSKSPENGARTYMAAATTKESEHGKIVQFYRGEKQLQA